ncbi:MAG: D-sedoheptulose 7-phosphate isomerase [bacterium]
MQRDQEIRWRKQIQETFRGSLRIQEEFFSTQSERIVEAAHLILRTLRAGGKLMLAGNGGSAADAQHLAAEFVNRYRKERPALPAVALTTDTSVLTSIANDHDFGLVFSRQIEALGNRGDLLLVISTSGNSPNILDALRKAREMGIATLALTGGDGGAAVKAADLALCVSASRQTPRIQEAFLLLEHLFCDLVEEALFPSKTGRTESARRTDEL